MDTVLAVGSSDPGRKGGALQCHMRSRRSPIWARSPITRSAIPVRFPVLAPRERTATIRSIRSTSSTSRRTPDPVVTSPEVATSAMTSTPVVEVMRVDRSFGDLTVLTDVDFSVERGHIHGLIGPNGVGKTTLLRIVAGLVDPTSGQVRVLGGEASAESVRTRIGWIPGGDRTFYLRLSGKDNLVFFGRMYGLSKRIATERATDLMDTVGLSE